MQGAYSRTLLIVLLQLQGNPYGQYAISAEACEETFNREAVVVYLEVAWAFFIAECSDYNAEDFGISKQKALPWVRRGNKDFNLLNGLNSLIFCIVSCLSAVQSFF